MRKWILKWVLKEHLLVMHHKSMQVYDVKNEKTHIEELCVFILAYWNL